MLGGGEQVVAFAGAFGGQQWVAAGDQPLAGEVGVGDLGKVLGVEQAHLQRPVVGGQGGDLRGAQRGDPPEIGCGVGIVVEFTQGGDAGLCDHAAVTHQHQLVEREGSRITWTISVNATGSAVLPGNTRAATGRPAGSVRMPYSICSQPFLPSRE